MNPAGRDSSFPMGMDLFYTKEKGKIGLVFPRCATILWRSLEWHDSLFITAYSTHLQKKSVVNMYVKVSCNKYYFSLVIFKERSSLAYGTRDFVCLSLSRPGNLGRGGGGTKSEHYFLRPKIALCKTDC